MSGLRLILQTSLGLRRVSPLKQTCRNVTAVTSTGSVLSKPKLAYDFGIVRIVLFTTPFIYAGAMAAKWLASSLEEFDVFVPDDDDD